MTGGRLHRPADHGPSVIRMARPGVAVLPGVMAVDSFLRLANVRRVTGRGRGMADGPAPGGAAPARSPPRRQNMPS